MFLFFFFFFFNDTATTEIYTLSLHDALPISARRRGARPGGRSDRDGGRLPRQRPGGRPEPRQGRARCARARAVLLARARTVRSGRGGRRGLSPTCGRVRVHSRGARAVGGAAAGSRRALGASRAAATLAARPGDRGGAVRGARRAGRGHGGRSQVRRSGVEPNPARGEPVSSTKDIFVTGGAVTFLGKGLGVAVLGRLLVERGLRTTIQKFDPYINVDPGTMSP